MQMSKAVQVVVYFLILSAAWSLLTFVPQTHAGEELNHMQKLMTGLMYVGLGAIFGALAMDLARRR